jgi:beta-glucosidase
MPIAFYRTDIEINSLPTRFTFNCEDGPMRLTKLYALSLLLASMAAVTIPSAGAQDRLFSNEAKQKAAALLKQMTLDEKVGQLNESPGIGMPGIATEKPDDLIAKGGVGSILWQMDAP